MQMLSSSTIDVQIHALKTIVDEIISESQESALLNTPMSSRSHNERMQWWRTSPDINLSTIENESLLSISLPKTLETRPSSVLGRNQSRGHRPQSTESGIKTISFQETLIRLGAIEAVVGILAKYQVTNESKIENESESSNQEEMRERARIYGDLEQELVIQVFHYYYF